MELAGQARLMAQYFAPDPESYGSYPSALTPSETTPGKLENPQKGITVSKRWGMAQIENHLKGIGVRFGCVPISSEKQTIRFMAVDVDKDARGEAIYGAIDLPQLAKRLFQIHPMLFVLRSKSGGPHIYAFFREDVQSALVRPKMREIMSSLGWGTLHEYFPKQDKIDIANKEFGNWINLPYYGTLDPNQVPLQYSFNPQTGEALSLDDFLGHLQLRAGTYEEFLKISLKGDDLLKDGPPCLQRILGEMIEINRNVIMSNMCVYLRQKYPDDWHNRLDEYNQMYSEPLSATELHGVLKSQNKSNYRYGCSTEPMHSYCNKPLCNTRKYGYNAGSSHPFIVSLTKHDSDPPIWWIYFDGGQKMRVSTEDLQSPLGFQRRAMEQMNSVPPVMKQSEWSKMLQEMMKKVTIVKVPESATQYGLMKQYIIDYLTMNAPGETMEELLAHKPVLVDEQYHFQLGELIAWLSKKSFGLAKPEFITLVLGQMGAKYSSIRIAKTTRVVYSLPSTVVEGFNEELPMPEINAPVAY